MIPPKVAATSFGVTRRGPSSLDVTRRPCQLFQEEFRRDAPDVPSVATIATGLSSGLQKAADHAVVARRRDVTGRSFP